MNILYVDGDASTKAIAQIVGKNQNMEIDGRYLPPERRQQDGNLPFATERDLVNLVWKYDGAVLDWTTFGHEVVRGGNGSALPKYLLAIRRSGYQGMVAVTTAISEGVEDEVRSIVPGAIVFKKPFSIPNLLNALENKHL